MHAFKCIINLQKVGKSSGHGNERSASVQDGTGRLELSSLVAESDGIKIDLPVSLAAKGEVGHLASVVVLVDATKHGLGLRLLVIGVAQIERKHRVVKETLLDGRVEWRWDAVDTDRVVAKA